MNYNNFDTQLTDKLGIICVGWPLPKFVSPSDVGSKVELDLLYNAWKNGAARFKRLSAAALNARRLECQHSGSTPIDSHASSPAQSTPVLPTPPSMLTPGLAAEPSLPLPPPPPPTIPAPQSAPSSVTGVILGNGQTVLARKPRKRRSDAGVPRGPRKKAKTTEVASTATAPATAPTASTTVPAATTAA